MTTRAQQISNTFVNNGSIWKIKDGLSIYTVCAYLSSDADHNRDRELTKYIFPDGSAIIFTASGWDIGYKDCWCMAGNGHSDDCQQQQ